MKLIEPNVQEITDFEGVDNFYKAVTRAARICYASDKTTDDKELCERLIKSGHFSPFEHAIIYIPYDKDIVLWKIGIEQYQGRENKYLVFYTNSKHKFAVYAINGRVIVESLLKKVGANDIIPNLDSILAYTKNYEVNSAWFGKMFSFKSFIVDTSIGCTREMNRHHDNFYICEQSTRYCNFSKDKFGNEVAFNKPYWYDTKSDVYKEWWEGAMKNAEMLYMTAIRNIPNDLRNCSDDEFGMGFPIDEARGILPLDTHTRAIYTATIEEWKHIIDLRLKGTTGKPHGDIMIIADKIDKLINNK